MEEFLSVRQLQEILQVDRVTIYRMLQDGRLRGLKVGGRWRFRRADVEAFLGLRPPDVVLQPERTQADPVPAGCVRALQLVLSEALEVPVAVVGIDGRPLQGVSGAPRFCAAVLEGDAGRARCAAAFARASTRPWPCHAGLLCLGQPVRVQGQVVARVVACGFATVEKPWWPDVDMLVAELGVPVEAVNGAAAFVRVLSAAEERKVTRVLARAAEALAEMALERLAYQERLQWIRQIARLD